MLRPAPDAHSGHPRRAAPSLALWLDPHHPGRSEVDPDRCLEPGFFPAASVPVTLSRERLPIAVQLVALPGGEDTILGASKQIAELFSFPRGRRRASSAPLKQPETALEPGELLRRVAQ